MAEAAQDVLSSDYAYSWAEGARGRSSGLDRLLDLIDSDNIAADLSEEELNRLGERCLREFQIDKSSRSEWEENTKEALKIAKQVVEEKNYPWPKAANIKYPLLTTAAIQFAARAYPAIINGPDVVKCRVQGKDDGIPAPQQPQQLPGGAQPPGMAPPAGAAQPGAAPAGAGPTQSASPPEQQWQVPPGAKQQRADRVGHHMSWQLLEEMPSWEEQTDKLLHVVPIVGCAFRKTYFDPSLGRNKSDLVLADDFVINYWAESIDTAPRYTHLVRLYPHEIEERIRDERFIWFEYGSAQPTEETEREVDPTDEDAPHEFLEQHRLEDLDNDGYPEPYIVTVHRETGKVARIKAGFGLDGVKTDNKTVLRIEREKYFTKYPFIPALDGGFYDIGFGCLLRPLSEAINTSINQMIDAGHLQNTGGGFIGSGLRIKGGDARFRPGEYKRVISTGGSIKDNIVPMQWEGPSLTLFNLLGLLIEAARDITSVKDVMTGGEGPQNEAATRTLARIEQGMKVFSAIYKRLFRSLKAEFRKLYRLNARYMEEGETYFTLLDDPEAVSRQDYNTQDLDVVPVADPNMITEQQRMAQAEHLMMFLQDPHFEPYETRKRILSAVGQPDLDELLVKELPPNPELMAKADELEIEKRQTEIEALKAQTSQQEMLAKVAEIKSKVILNLAKAEAESDKVEIESLKVLLDTILQKDTHDIERGKAMDTREANEQKADIDRRRVSSVAGASDNKNGV